MENDYEFTNDWFITTCCGTWADLMPRIKPTKILEIGCYEGQATCWLIDNLEHTGSLEIHCIDTWLGKSDIDPTVMPAVEQRFHSNLEKARSQAAHPPQVVLHKGASTVQLACLIAEGKRDYFDFIYIDGSHEPSDVLTDAVQAWHLLRAGGIMAFDDYTWLNQGPDRMRCPRPAIDAFTDVFRRELTLVPSDPAQRYVLKNNTMTRNTNLSTAPYGQLYVRR
jgi:predicted O-methyltransferase YrrM